MGSCESNTSTTTARYGEDEDEVIADRERRLLSPESRSQGKNIQKQQTIKVGR